ncbi:hypothetical protein ABZZ16_17045 [Streptomyces sp. NPDC006386]|uniref:hypothetical protein n=1 Tax=Streptomyces sp. NPDC006386 TaxID=3156762 RepID=UPI0033BD4EDD
MGAESWALVWSLADAGTTVLAVCSEAPVGALRVSTHDNPDQGEEKADALAETGRA